MARLKVDTDVMQSTITTYTSAIEDIENAIKDAQNAIDVLRNSGWKTNASKAFFRNFDHSWKNNVNNRVKVMKHLNECLQQAKADYETLYQEASQLGKSI